MPVGGLQIASLILGGIGSLASVGTRMSQLSKRIDREANEMQKKLEYSNEALQLSEEQYKIDHNALYISTRDAINELSTQSYTELNKSYEIGMGGFLDNLRENLIKSQRTNRLQGISSSFISKSRQMRSSLYSQRVSNAIADYENQVAQERKAKKSSLLAMEFFSGLLPVASNIMGALAPKTSYQRGLRSLGGT